MDLPHKDILIVEDTLDSGETLKCAFQSISRLWPNPVDIVSCGLDRKDWVEYAKIETIELYIESAFIGFDYWGWLVFPWEKQTFYI